MKKRSPFHMNSNRWFVLMALIAAGLIITSLTADFFASPIRMVAGYVITPFQNGINDIGTWLVDRSSGLRDSRELAEENADLRRQIDDLVEKNNQLIQSQDELDRLRELYQLDKQYEDYTKVAAEVISKDPGNWYDTFVINKGSRDGLKVDMNVIGQGGLIGIITEIGDNWAQVRSIIDDESNVSVMLTRTSNAFMVRGSLLERGNGKLEFFQLRDPDDEAKEGDAVVTSNISSKFLPGILVGYISDVREDANELTKSGTVVPVADFTNLREVLVILDLKQTKD